jgi:hypothetical protein
MAVSNLGLHLGFQSGAQRSRHDDPWIAQRRWPPARVARGLIALHPDRMPDPSVIR